MPEKRNDQHEQAERRPAAPPTRQVVVTHLDSPPPSGKHIIHPRRPAPIVPTREERTGEKPVQDPDCEESSREGLDI